MTSYPIVGTKGNVTCATASTMLNTLFGTSNTTGTVRVQTWGISPNQPASEVTGFLSAGVTSRANMTGLTDATFEVMGFYPKTITAGPAATTPRFGNAGLITCSDLNVELVESYSLEFEFGEEKITGMASSAPTFHTFMPAGIVAVRGSYTTRHMADAVLKGPKKAAAPFTINTGGSAATFKLVEDGANDPNFAGGIVVPTGPRFTVDAKGGQVKATYDFIGDGNFTSLAGSTLPALFGPGDGSTAIGPTEWDTNSDGTPDVTCVFTSFTGLTYTCACFLRSIKIDVNVGEPIKVTATIRASGAIS